MFVSRWKQVPPVEAGSAGAVLVSFFGGAERYASCARRLADQCTRLGLSHDICEYVPGPGESWSNICRRKVAFYTAKLVEHGRPVFWVDADTQILNPPGAMLRPSADFGAYLRNFGYLVGFDPMQFGRLVHPGYLALNHTERALRFAEHLRAVDATADETATDDFVLQEALTSFAGRLGIELFSPETVAFGSEVGAAATAVFLHGDSGQAPLNQGSVPQHAAELLSADRQIRVMREAASDAITNGWPEDAAVFLKRIRRLRPDDSDSLRQLLGLYVRTDQMGKYRFHLEKAKGIPAVRSTALRIEIDRRLATGDVAGAARMMDDLATDASDDDRAYIASRSYRYAFETRALSSSVADEDRVRMWWWEQPFPGNLGDVLSPLLVERLSGAPPKYTHKSPRVITIGSIIKYARAGDTVWGAGAASVNQRIDPQATFTAVRGPLTRALVLKAGGACPEVYGDPAWLLPLVYPGRRAAKTHRVGLIRHFTHRDVPIALDPEVKEIEVLRTGEKQIEAFIDEMLSCEAVVSTSLHGLILANAYGIPARFATFSGSSRQVHGDGMKFDDYFLSIGRTGIVPLDLSGEVRISAAIATLCTDNPAHPIDLERLLEAAPFATLPLPARA